MKFELGKTVVTMNASHLLNMLHVLWILRERYCKGDWGDLCESDKQENERALKCGERLLGSYKDVNGTKFWIITEADRSCTTILLPEDY